MRYLVLLMGDGDELPWDEQTPQEREATMQTFGDFARACAGREGVEILSGEALDGPSSATTVRWTEGSRAVTDGPFAEAVEGLGGFYLLEAPDLDVVLELIQLLPRYDIQISPAIDVG